MPGMGKCVYVNVLAICLDNELTVFQVEFTGGLGRPKTHGVHNIVPVSWHRSVVWQGQNNLLAGTTKWDFNSRQLCSHTVCPRDTNIQLHACSGNAPPPKETMFML